MTSRWPPSFLDRSNSSTWPFLFSSRQGNKCIFLLIWFSNLILFDLCIMIYNSGTYRRAPFTFPEFLGHSFHFLSSVLPPFRPFEARLRPFSLSFDFFSHFLFFSVSLFFSFFPSLRFLSSQNNDYDLTWHIMKHRDARPLYSFSMRG